MKKLILIFSILIFSISHSNAEEIYSVRAYLPCGQFLTACDKSKLDIDCEVQTFWTLGYISALSWEQHLSYSENVFNKDNIKYSLIKYCKANPFSDTHEGAEDIFTQLQ